MKRVRRGLTLMELMVVLGITSMLLAIFLPALGEARRQARRVLGITNQRQIVDSANNFAWDHRDQYPQSVATIGTVDLWWNWQEPMMLTGHRARHPRLHRSLSAYLGEYIKDAETMYCPNAPEPYPYLQEAWDAGDDWDHPETPPVMDPLTGTYGFYWNYLGYLERRSTPFRGPRNISGSRGESKLMVADYFGYDHWRSPQTFSSCEKFRSASVTRGTWVSSAYWSDAKTAANPMNIDIELHAGYSDSHVESFSPQDVIPMQVSITSDGKSPYPAGVGPGYIFLPKDSIY